MSDKSERERKWEGMEVDILVDGGAKEEWS